jgi:hypothetical protein
MERCLRVVWAWMLRFTLPDCTTALPCRLLKQTTAAGRKGLWYIAEEAGGALSGKMDHLVCFLPGG